MPAHRRAPRLSTAASAALRRLAVTTAGAAPWLAVQAAPMPPFGGRLLTVITQESVCHGNNVGNASNFPCVETSAASVSAIGLQNTAGHRGAVQASVTPTGADVHAQSTSVRVIGGQTLIPVGATLIQFDMLTVQGPTATVPLSVVLDIHAQSSLVSDAPFVRGSLAGMVGFRAGSSSDSYNTLGDRIDLSRSVARGLVYASTSRGLQFPVVDLQGVGSITVPVGSPFEFGFEFTVTPSNLDTTASMRFDLSLPEGYTLTGTRGLAVNLPAVPEPAQAMLMLGGLAALGVFQRRRRRG